MVGVLSADSGGMHRSGSLYRSSSRCGSDSKTSRQAGTIHGSVLNAVLVQAWEEAIPVGFMSMLFAGSQAVLLAVRWSVVAGSGRVASGSDRARSTHRSTVNVGSGSIGRMGGRATMGCDEIPRSGSSLPDPTWHHPAYLVIERICFSAYRIAERGGR